MSETYPPEKNPYMRETIIDPAAVPAPNTEKARIPAPVHMKIMRFRLPR